MTNWTTAQIPNLKGKVAIVTGGTGGLGYESVLELARNHAHVVIAARNEAKAQAARIRILQELPTASLEIIPLDLGNLQSVHAFVEAFRSCHDRLDILINNAGVAAATRYETSDGFELQMGVNHLGHFALTGLLLEQLLSTPHSRIVTVSSGMYSSGWLHFDDLQRVQQRNVIAGYPDSKLANIHFMRELHHRLERMGSSTRSLAAHPGLSKSEMAVEGAGWARLLVWYTNVSRRFLGQSVAMAVLPQLYAATAADVQGGTLIGPEHRRVGYPRVEPMVAHALDRDIGAQLWEISETLTGVRYEALHPVMA